MASFPVQLLLGIYLGLVTGIVPALVAWTLGFLFKYFTNVSIPGFGVVVLSLAIAGVNGGLLALNDETIREASNGTAILVAIIVVLMLSLYAHAKGDAMGAATPKRITLERLKERSLSTDVVELVGGRGQVNVTVAGDVGDLEGYPPLPAGLRAEIREATIDLPADLPLAELESRAADRLRSDFDLADVSVRLDERGRATVAAAPPTGGLSKRVPQGKRAVSVSALVPTGLARGDEVDLETPEGSFLGTVLSVTSGGKSEKGDAKGDTKADGPTVATDGGESVVEEAPQTPASTAASGGRGRVTVAVDRATATTLLRTDVTRLTVRSRGERKEFELATLLRRAGKRIRRLSVRDGSALAGVSLGEAAVRDEYGVVVLAVRTDEGWQFAPGGRVELAAGTDLFAVGTARELDAFKEAIA
jgi:hypothetical protein